MFSKKTQKLITTIIAVMLVISMVLPLIIGIIQ